MLDAPSLDVFYDLRVVFIAVVWLMVIILVVAALHRCHRSYSKAPILYHFASHIAIAAEVFAIIFAAASRRRPNGTSAIVDPDEERASDAFIWTQRLSILVWLILSRWMYYFTPRTVVGFVIVCPVASEWTRISLQLLSAEDIEPIQMTVDAIVVLCQFLSFASVVGWKWLFLTDVELLFRQIPEITIHEDAIHDDDKSDDTAPIRSNPPAPGVANDNNDTDDVIRRRQTVDRFPSAARTRISDTLPLENGLTVETAVDDMRTQWQHGSVLWSLWSRWKSSLLMLALVRLVYDVLGLIPAWLLRVLVDNLSDPHSTTGTDVRTSIVVIALLLLCSVVSTFLRVHFNLKLQKIALFNRGLLSDCISRHVLRVRTSKLGAHSAASQGDIINHMTVDAQRIADSIGGFFDLWALPLQVAFTLCLLYVQVSFAFIAGVAITIALIPVNMVLAKKISKVNTNMLAYNDERVLRINEVINNIVYVKMCGWAAATAEWIGGPREKYMECLRWVKMLDALCVFFWATTPVFVSLATFAVYVAIGGELTPGRAVAALSLFNALILPLNAYPWVINGSVEAYVSLRRMQAFLGPFIRKEQRFEQAVRRQAAPPKLWPTPSDAEASSGKDQPFSDDSSSSGDEKKGLIRRTLGRSKRRHAVRAVNACDDSDDPRRSASRTTERSIPSIFNSARKSKSQPQNEPEGKSALSDLTDVMVEIENCRYHYNSAKSSPLSATTNEDTSISSNRQADPTAIAKSKSLFHLLRDEDDGPSGTGTSSDEFSLHTLYVASFSARKGQLITIVGPAGAGKSTLISGIAGEICRKGGEQRVQRQSVALVEQSPFLVQGTIKSNILCGAAYRKEWFDHVIRLCALDEDLKQCELRENTPVGDRGSGLSGGQKFRVALARAVYADKQLLLVDDGLGCLDAEVANHIVDQVFVGLCRTGKCIIVATHSNDLINRSDKTYVARRKQVSLLAPRERDAMLQLNVNVPSTDSTLTSVPRREGNEEPADNRPLSLDDDGSADRMSNSITQIAVVLKDPSETAGKGAASATTISASEVGREVVERGLISWGSVRMYLDHVGWFMVVVVIVFIAAMQAARNLGDWYVAVWVSDTHSSSDQLIKTLGIIAAANALLAVVRGVSFAFAGLIAARKIHDELLRSVLSASYHFFMTTSPGRIINRLSRDIYNIDDSLPFIVNILLAQLFLFIGSVIVIIANSSWVVIVLFIPIISANYWFQKPYRRVSREIKRLESAARSPVIDDLRRQLDGGAVIRAMGADTMTFFMKKSRFDTVIFLRTNVNLAILQAWFSIRLQLVGCAILGVVGAVTVYYHSFEHAASLGLALAYVSPLTSYVSGLLSALADTEKQFVSMERVVEYMRVESESQSLLANTSSSGGSSSAAAISSPLVLRGSVWPLFGTIQFNDVSLRYDTDGPLVLRNVTLHVEAGEKLAIVGRTGAGKTSLFVALLRLIRLSRGSILIDSEDIRRVDPEELRQRIAVFPQDPFIFHGTVRRNVDPFDRATDDEVHLVLQKVQLGHLTLSYVVEEGGKNLSTGQRYLLALARVALQQSCVLLLDEPSAKIDKESDTLLWSLVDSLFKDCTVVTITHNLDHIDWFDRVVVMDRGAVAACGTPSDMKRERVGPFGAAN